MKRLNTVIIVGLAGFGQTGQTTDVSQATLTGLENAYDVGGLIEDRNGDGHVDFVSAHLVVSESAPPNEIVTAANIAARLAFETESLDFPMYNTDAGIPIFIGRSAALSGGVSGSALDGDLDPGLGVVSLVSTATGSGIVLFGGDDVGLRAAALAFGGRGPHIWAVDGPTYGDVSSSVRAVLMDAGVNVAGVFVKRIVADDDPGLRRVDVSVTTEPGGVLRAVDVLTEIARSSPSATPDDTTESDTTSTNTSLRFDGLRLLLVDVTSTDGTSEVVFVANHGDHAEFVGRRPGAGNKSRMTLSNLYSNDGFLGDGDDNLIPDRVEVLLTTGSDPSPSVIDLAARIALESTGFTYPLVVPADEIEAPDASLPLVIVGADNTFVRRLSDSGKVVLPELDVGEGWVGVVPEAFGEKSAVVVIGGDRDGEARAVQQLAEYAPHIWTRGKGQPTLTDIDEDLRRTLAGRSPIGQAAMAAYKLDQVVAELSGQTFVHARANIFVEKADVGLAEFLEARVRQSISAESIAVTVGNLDVQNARPIFEEETSIPGEVAEFWRVFNSDILPRVRRGEPVSIEARLSEPPQIRRQISEQAEQLIRAASASDDVNVRIVSAYKQGFSWLAEFVAPRLRQLEVDEILIRFAEVGPPEAWPQQAMYTPTRWLLEIFPIDEVLARDVGVSLSRVTFEMLPIGSHAYEVVGKRAGETVHQETFEPAIHLRPYFDRFPDYEMSRVTTGWVTGMVGADTVVNQRIATDIEAFWDYFQSETLMRIYEHVMAANDGRPRSSDAPHFGELIVDVSLSEPDYQIGIDQEQVASMEALHEEIYFGVLHFFDVLGRMARGQELSYPGRVIPIVRPRANGEPGSARVSFSGFDAPRPMVELVVRADSGRTRTIRRELLPVPIETPQLLTGKVRAGEPGWAHLGYRVPVDFDLDQRAEWVRRTSARNVDGNITTAEQATSMVRVVEELRSAGLYADQLAYEHTGSVEIAAYWSHEFDADSQRTVTLPPNGAVRPVPELRARNDRRGGARLVQWDTPIPPPEAAEILARMSSFREANVYWVGRSYLGKDIWAMDLVAPVDGAFWSQAKATARKPTVIYSARQHANEVSSTSHVLRLAEQILTDTAYAEVLDAVNVVIHPITNPDGAQLAYDLYQITPNHMLHAGYLGSLGVDVSSGQGGDDPIYPETNVRPRLWQTWLPDIFLNPHGYPSHEWVQIFSEYAGWVRNRVTSQRGWWGMRGWFMPSFNYVDSPEFPRHREAAFAIRDRITAKINALPQIRALNVRAYDRYRRYTFAFDSDNFKLDFSDSVLIYTSLTGSSGGGGTMSNPRVTIWSGTTEAPDETASGDWLELVASAGLAWDHALLEYLIEGNHVVERTEVAFDGGVTFKIHRERPPKNAEEN